MMLAERRAMRYRKPQMLPAAAVLVIVAAMMAGCGAIPGLKGEKDPNPPTPIDKKLPQQVSLNTLWKTRIGKGTDERQVGLTPVLANGRLYAADPSGSIVALSPRDGRVLWERKTGFAFSGGPAVAGDTLLVGTSDGELVALSTGNGAQKWRAQLGSEILSVPRVVGDLIVVHTIDDSVHGMELADGSRRWRFAYQAPILTLRGSSTPAVVGEDVIVGFSGGKIARLEPEAGVPLWETTVTPPHGRSELDRIADIDADPVVVGNAVYVGTYNGDLAAVDVDTGSVLWRRELSAYAGLAADDSALYITDSDDNIWAANPADGSGLWRQEKLAHRRLTAPALLGSYLAVGDLEGYLHLLSRRDGRLLGYERVSKDRIGQAPVVADGLAYVYANDGTVAAVRAGSLVRPEPGASVSGAGAASKPPPLKEDNPPEAL